MTFDRRILPLRPRRSTGHDGSRGIFDLSVVVTAEEDLVEEEDIRLSFDHAGDWADGNNRKTHKVPGASSQTQKKTADSGVQHNGFELPHSRLSSRVSKGRGRRLEEPAQLFGRETPFPFDFRPSEPGIGLCELPPKPNARHAGTQTSPELLPEVTAPKKTFSNSQVRFVNRSRRKFMRSRKQTIELVSDDADVDMICAFCDYEAIYGEPPYALIAHYEIQERRKRKERLAQAKRVRQAVKTTFNDTTSTASETHPDFPPGYISSDLYLDWERLPPDRRAWDHTTTSPCQSTSAGNGWVNVSDFPMEGTSYQYGG